MAKVLVVYYTLGGNTKTAAEAVAGGARSAGADVIMKTGLEAGPEDLLACDAIAVGTPDYFSYMAGGLKDFFDRSLYPTRGQVTGKPCGIFVTHGGGGRAVESMKSICGSFKFEQVADPVLVLNSPDAKATEALEQLGSGLAEAAQRG